MGYLTNSGTGFLKGAVTTVSNVKSYLINKTGYLVDAIRVGIGDFGQRVLDDGGTVEASSEAAASYREITKDIYDQASLVLFPSGYKDNLVYSHKPVDGSGDFTYTRGTDTATRVGADGYIKKERANLLVQSNQFDTTWVSVTASVTSGQSGYDGSNDAWLLSKSAASGRIYQNASVSGVATYSVYAKSNDLDWLFIIGTASSYPEAYFNLSNGTIGNTSNHQNFIGANIEDVGNGWYRCSITFNDSLGQFRIYPADGNNDFSGTSGSIYIQDAQLEQGLVANPYIETTTAPVYEGLTDNLPRIDYTGGTPSLLLEPSRVNALPQSEYFGGSDWEVRSYTLQNNAAVSPEGVSNATKIIPNNGTTNFRIRTSTALNSSGDVFDSVFAKYIEGEFQYIVLASTNTQQRYVFDVKNGTKIGSIGSTSIADENTIIESYGNGWYRLGIKTNQSGNGKFEIYFSDDGTNITATGNGSKGMYVWGAQVEQGATYPTSYIPTYNASATRAGEGQSSSDFSAELSTALSDAYTVFLDFEVTNNEDTTLNFADIFNFKFDESLSKDAVKIETYHIGGVDSIRVFVYKQSSGTQATSVAPNVIPMGSRVKLACVLDDSYGVKIFYNGTKIIDHQEITAYEQTKFLKGSGVNGNIRSKTLLNKILAFSTALSEDDCEALTAL